MLVHDICSSMEAWAPLDWQESYDNSGLLTGNRSQAVTGVLVSFDCTEAVVEEAIAKGCNMIVAHHPILFKGIKQLTGRDYVERTLILAIKHDIAIYASHTNLDHAPKGVSYQLAQKLGLQAGKVLRPMQDALRQLTYYVPVESADQVREALHAAGAGNIGEYTDCSFSSVGTGRFTPSSQANPAIGQAGKPEEVSEMKVDLLFPKHLESAVIGALFKAHPYEEVAYFVTSLGNAWKEVGAGYVGELPEALGAEAFARLIKEKLNLIHFRHTPWLGNSIKRVALCGGAGSFLLKDAIRVKADVYISGDFKYHEFFDAENHLTICDIGHYESEIMIKDSIHEYLSNNFSTFAVLKSMTHTNPVSFA
jgi:dinuclear metal center YbgI/SA1388 family protein